MHPCFLTNLSIVNCLGAGQAATIDALQAGRSGLLPCTFETVDLPTYVGEVLGLDDISLPAELAEYDCRNNRLAWLALQTDGFYQAAAAARDKYGPDRVGLFLGTSTSGILETEQAYRQRDPATGSLPDDFRYAGAQNTYSVAAFVRAALGLTGLALVVSAACASTSKAFGNATRMIEAGLCDAAIVGGADTLCLTTLYGFNSLQLTAEQACRPFDAARSGISIGEGAGLALVEREGPVDAIHLLGLGESSDAYHMSSPHPEGIGAQLAMEHALASAKLPASAIDYLNLHGTATSAGDAAEDRAVSRLFPDTPCSSIKGYTGHTLGASGIVEAVIAALCLRHGFMPGSLPTQTLDPSLQASHLLTGTNAPLETVMSNSFGFGGSNCSLILGRAA